MMQAGSSCFDFAFIPAGPIGQTVELVRLGEELGYRCAWLPDQTFHRDPFTVLAICAQSTSSIGLGLGITSPYTRLPVQIARAAAAVDEIAAGRFRLGLGTANVDHVLTPLGIAMSNPVGRLRDSITIIKRLMAGEQVDFDGIFDHLRKVKLDFAPIRNHIPIYIGTRGPKILQLAAESCDGVLVESLFNANGLPYVFDNLRIGAARSGRSLSDVDVVAWQVVHVTDNVKEAVAAQKRWVARSIKVGPPDAMHRIGIEDDVVQRVTDAIATGDWEKAVALVPDKAVNCLMIIGNPDLVSQKISEIFEHGASTISLLLLGSAESHRENLVRFAREVMPTFC